MGVGSWTCESGACLEGMCTWEGGVREMRVGWLGMVG